SAAQLGCAPRAASTAAATSAAPERATTHSSEPSAGLTFANVASEDDVRSTPPTMFGTVHATTTITATEDRRIAVVASELLVRPDVAIVDDWRALGWAALRARHAGLVLSETAFVVHCHGVGRVLVEFAQKVPDTLDRFGESIAERAALELADAAVSPSAWLLD